MNSTRRAGGAMHAGTALVSAAGLILQVALTRVFAVSQWYHFAFMAVGLGLLGYGASGSVLSTVPGLRRDRVRTAAWSALLMPVAIGVGWLAIVAVPFDAYLIALDPIQALYLAAQVTALVVPFLCAGLVVGAVLAEFPESSATLYAASFAGAAAGAVAAVALLARLTGPGAMHAGGAIAALGAVALWWARSRRGVNAAGSLGLAALLAALIAPDVPMSPYKALSQLRRLPDATVEFSRRNAVSRVDVVRSAAIRIAPGLSHIFDGVPPALPTLVVDGEGMRGLPTGGDAAFTDYLTNAAAYRLRRGSALIVGMSAEVMGALRHGVSVLTVVEAQPLAAEAARPHLPRGVRVVVEHPRTFVRRARERFDVIAIPPQESFQVVASGAFSLTEHYLYTVEAFEDYLRLLSPGGVLATTRWIQTPPSEEIRVWAALVEAMERLGRDPRSTLAALRSLNTVTLLAAPGEFTKGDLEALTTFAVSRRFDIIYAPGSQPGAARFAALPGQAHEEAFLAVLDPAGRRRFLTAYPFDVTPARDARPFFFHFFRWQQIPAILAGLGRTWQPFGGGGYLVLVVMLVIVVVLSVAFILVPIRWVGAPGPAPVGRAASGGAVLGYFLLLGMAFLFVEIPLLQQAILLLGFPTYAVAAVLFGLLLASGAGSLIGPHLGGRVPRITLGLGAACLVVAVVFPGAVNASLGLTVTGRAAVLAVFVVPLGVLMGMPFPAGIRALGRTRPALIPWAWGINGCASVVGSIVAAMVALEWGFRAVFLLAGLGYAAAGLIGLASGWMRQPGRGFA